MSDFLTGGKMELTREHAVKVLEVIDAGLSEGLGKPERGQMCIQAAINYALGQDHGDKVWCVGYAVREADIVLNDSAWSSPEARAKGMRREAIAKLGSHEIDQVKFAQMLAEETIRQIVPIALLAAAKLHKDKAHKDALLASADRCQNEGSDAASDAASFACDAARAARAASDAASNAAHAASFAARNAARAASFAARAASNAAHAASFAARAASFACDAASDAARDVILTKFANICADILIKLGSQGAKWLDIL